MPGFDALAGGLVAVGVAAGVVLLVGALRGGPVSSPASPARGPSRAARLVARLRSPATSGRLAGAVVAGVLTLVITRWPVAAVGITALVAWWPALFGGARLEARRIAELEALAIWTESLRDTVAARVSLEKAIPLSTVDAPVVIRPALTRMAGLLRHNVPLPRTLLDLAAELDHSAADQVIGALRVSLTHRGGGLGKVLSQLAASARAELDQQREITAGRASMRRGVQLMVVVVLAFAGYLMLAGGAYIKPYDSVAGQVVLAVVVGFFAAGFYWMRRLAGGPPDEPFLTRPGAQIDAAERLLVAHLTGLSEAEAGQLVANPAPDGGAAVGGSVR